MASYNRCVLLGNLGQDPELKTMPSGDKLANISVATTDQWRDKATGEKREETQWHNVSAFGRTAEVIGQYARKGSPVLIEGSIRYRQFTDKDGNKRTATEIRADRVVLLGTGRRESDPLPSDRPGQRPQERPSAPLRMSSGYEKDFDSDIPF